MNIPTNHFDRGKPFYPLVILYVAQILGFHELLLRGVLGARDISVATALKSLKHFNVSSVDSSETLAEYVESLRRLAEPLSLKCEFDGGRIGVDADEMAKELIEARDCLMPFIMRSAGSLLVLAQEITKDKPYRDKGPLWEFLRHCRNAIAHNGLFNLVNGEPRRIAAWSRFKLEPSMHGMPLFKDPNNGLLSPGDPIRLLWDIEQAYPSMKV